MRWLDGITALMYMSLSKFQKFVMNRDAGMLQSMGSQRVWHDSGTELNLTGHDTQFHWVKQDCGDKAEEKQDNQKLVLSSISTFPWSKKGTEQ